MPIFNSRKTVMHRPWIGLCALIAYAMPTFGQAATTNALPDRTTRAGLYAALDSYLAALKAHDPNRVAWADVVRNSENNVELMIGDGLWGTITALGSYDLRFADTQTGEVGFFGTVTETRDTSAFTLRMKVIDGRIAEVESLVAREADSSVRIPNPRFESKPVLNEIVPPDLRLPRARMISIADGYFDTLQLNDGTLFTQFDPNCNRVENGAQTTNNSELKLTPVAALGCEAQFKLGYYRIDDRLRARRYPLVDEERGLVLAAAFIDRTGRLGKYMLTDGREWDSRVRRPHTYMLMELFKIRNGRIQQIEATFITVPYHMPSPWSSD